MIISASSVVVSSTSVILSPMSAVFVVLIFPDINSFGRFAIVFAVLVIFGFVYDWGTGRDVGSATIFTIPGDVDITVPTVIDEVNRPATGAILIAVSVPIFYMTGRYTKIDRGIPGLYPSDDNRLLMDQTRWRVVADVDAAIKRRIPYLNRYPGIYLNRWHGKEDCQCGGKSKKIFHCILIVKNCWASGTGLKTLVCPS
jgi:hypothetical protein